METLQFMSIRLEEVLTNLTIISMDDGRDKYPKIKNGILTKI